MASRIEEKQAARAQRLAAEDAERRAGRRRASLMRLGLALAVAAVVVVAAIVISSGSGTGSPASGPSGGAGDAAAAAKLVRGIPQRGVTLGAPSAKATLIEFADLQCPFCAEYSGQALPAVVRDYVRAGKLRYELHVRSFLGSDSVRAAGAAAEAAKENRLYQFADLFYRRQQAENTGYVTDGFIRGVARSAGVDPAEAVAAAGDAPSQPLVGQAEKLAGALGSNTTPDFFLRLEGGRLVPVVPRAFTPGAVEQAIDQALAQA
jgi:protein-disulfide isomerase